MEILSCAGIFFESAGTTASVVSVYGGDGRSTPHRRSQHRKPKASNSGRDRTRVLLIGLIRELALYRAEVLRHHGFLVHTPETIDQARAIIERGDFDIAVLSYTLPSNMVEEIADHVRETCPGCRIVAISETDRVDRRIAPDAVALAQQGPPALIAALRQVLRSH